MALSIRDKIVFVVLLCLLLLSMERDSPLISTNYASDPLMTMDSLFRKPGSFLSLTLLEPHLFLSKVVSPIAVAINLPRGYLVRDDYSAFGYVSRLRKCQISGIMRIFRFILWSRSFDLPLLSLLFNQSESTIDIDIHHIALLFVQFVAPLAITQIVLYSREYYDLLGAGCFSLFPQCLYAIDIVKCMMTRPNRENHRDYFDGYHHEYNFGYMIVVDCNGICRMANGHLPGSQNDLNNYYSSDLYQNPGLYLGLGARMLGDGIFARIEPHKFIVPVCGVRRPLTQIELNFNVSQRCGRSIVEHYISRMKDYCPRLRYYTYSVESIDPIFISFICLTNIRIKYQDPLRSYH